MNKVFETVAIVLGDNINTDLLHPPQYFGKDREKIKEGFLKGIAIPIPDSDNYIIIAGNNFGCGSSRETTIYAIKDAGVKCIVANSFSRIFKRSAFNLGLPCMEIKKQVRTIKTGEGLKVNMESSMVMDADKKSVLYLEKMEHYFQEILVNNGLIQFMERICKER